ncbi:DUF2642 domain-containing protein [Metabacillus sp. RGM 3146]|uniref:DUF2642 domain-containing protein n=1 Tax=Metabacillus sp. RGM 3146 TaxID=3401092 RepID=UPI003B9A162E
MDHESYFKALKSLIGYNIGIFSNEGSYIVGCLIDVKDDHIIIKSKDDKILYFNLKQINAISKNAKEHKINAVECDYLNSNNLLEILKQFKHSWVTINYLNPQPFSGVLSRVFEDHIILVSNEDCLYLDNAHLNSIFQGEITQADVINENAAESKMKENTAETKGNEVTNAYTALDQYKEEIKQESDEKREEKITLNENLENPLYSKDNEIGENTASFTENTKENEVTNVYTALDQYKEEMKQESDEKREEKITLKENLENPFYSKDNEIDENTASFTENTNENEITNFEPALNQDIELDEKITIINSPQINKAHITPDQLNSNDIKAAQKEHVQHTFDDADLLVNKKEGVSSTYPNHNFATHIDQITNYRNSWRNNKQKVHSETKKADEDFFQTGNVPNNKYFYTRTKSWNRKKLCLPNKKEKSTNCEQQFPEDLNSLKSEEIGIEKLEMNLNKFDPHEQEKSASSEQQTLEDLNSINRKEIDIKKLEVDSKKLDPHEQEKILETQYFSLMKFAEKKYNELKNKRLKKETKEPKVSRS